MTEGAPPLPTIVDAGPLVALIDSTDEFHTWSSSAVKSARQPLVTCECVIAEVLWLLRRQPEAPDALFGWIDRGILTFPFRLEADSAAVRRLMRKYADVPMSLADACVVRMAELRDDHRVWTLDADFRVYRKHGRNPIPLVLPDDR